MDVLTGLALFSGGALIGAHLVTSYYGALKAVQDHERRVTAQGMEKAQRYNEAMRMELDNRTRAMRRMDAQRREEASWCDGYEAGMREAMQGVTLGDVVTVTRLRRARMNQAANE